MMLAGYETTATALTWTLHALATHPDVQETLRAELDAVNSMEPTLDELNELKFLEAVSFSLIGKNMFEAVG